VETATRQHAWPTGRQQPVRPPVRISEHAIHTARAFEPARAAAGTHCIAGCGVRGLRRVRAIPKDLPNTVANPVARERGLMRRQHARVLSLETASAIASA
jgi:hypothetical protein